MDFAAIMKISNAKFKGSGYSFTELKSKIDLVCFMSDTDNFTMSNRKAK